jgi:hypothetical protein
MMTEAVGCVAAVLRHLSPKALRLRLFFCLDAREEGGPWHGDAAIPST